MTDGSFLNILNYLSSTLIGALVLFILSVATLITVLESMGFLPVAVSKFVFRHRVREIKSILSDLGVDFREQKKASLAIRIKSYLAGDDAVIKEARKIIDRNIKHGSFQVGKVAALQLNDFVDLMSASCSPQESQAIARCLSTYLRENLSQLSRSDFDFIATPKNGSPLIGYEFSKLLGKPLLLHDCNERKYHSENQGLEAISGFDFSFELKAGMIGLIVDDSTTGGRKVRSIVEDLRKFGCEVHDCLVVFEPQGKNVKSILKDHGVLLHSIVRR